MQNDIQDHIYGGGTAASQPKLRDPDFEQALVIISYICAVIIPIVGFVLGIVTLTRPNKATSKHGVWIVVASVVGLIVWVLIVAAVRASAHDACLAAGTC